MGGFIIEQWHWWAITLLALTFAGYSSSIKLAWAAVASTLVGGLLWFNPEFPLIFQLGIFVIFTALASVLTTIILSGQKDESGEGAEEDEPKRVLRVERLIGYVITLETPIVNGYGQFDIKGVTLRLRGEDCAIGEKVKVVGVDGIDRERLMVERLSGGVV